MQNRRDQIYDELLVLKCQQGNREAFELLVGRWQERLWRYVAGLTGSESGAWDVVQETWIAIIKGLSKLREPAVFPKWALRIASNKSTDWLRKQRMHGRLSSGFAGQSLAESDHSPNTDDKPETLEAALARLSPDQRALLMLRYVEGLEMGQIGEVLDIPEGTVKSRLNRTVAELRRLMGAQSDG